MFEKAKAKMMKALLSKKLADQGISPEMQDQLFGLIEKNPELFQKMGEEIKTRVDAGEDQTAVAMDVMKKYETELKGLSS